MIQKVFIFIAVLFITTCVAQPFTPYIPPGKKKNQALPLILPPRQTTTGCEVTITLPGTATTNASSQILLGVAGTKTSVQLALTEAGASANTTRTLTSSNTAVATVSNALITARSVGQAEISLDCSPSTKVTVLVSAVQNNLLEEKSLSENEIILYKDVIKNE